MQAYRARHNVNNRRNVATEIILDCRERQGLNFFFVPFCSAESLNRFVRGVAYREPEIHIFMHADDYKARRKINDPVTEGVR